MATHLIGSLGKFKEYMTDVRLDWLNSLPIGDTEHVSFDLETELESDHAAETAKPGWRCYRETGRVFMTIEDHNQEMFKQTFKRVGDDWMIDDDTH